MLHNVIVSIGIKIYKWSIHITGCHFVLYLSVQIGFLFQDNELENLVENKVILYMVILLGVNLVRKMALKTKVHKKKETRFQEKKNETTYI